MSTVNDGRHDFDFWPGRWLAHNRKLADMSEPGCTEWVEFPAVCDAHATLGGLGNVDTFSTNEFPGIGEFHGFTTRLFDPASRTWSIWWASTKNPGVLDVPVVGRWDGDRAEFFCDDVLNERPIKVRFEWAVLGPDTARWQQAFSYDAGESWELNWVMNFSREA